MRAALIILIGSVFANLTYSQEWRIVDIVSQNSKELVVYIDTGEKKNQTGKTRESLDCQTDYGLPSGGISIRKSYPRSRVGFKWKFSSKYQQNE